MGMSIKPLSGIQKNPVAGESLPEDSIRLQFWDRGTSRITACSRRMFHN
jgi:hypothetical protein